MRHRVLVMLAVLVMAGAAIAYAQAPVVLTVQVAYPFTMAGKELPAGKYTFEATNAGLVTMKGADGGSLSTLSVTSLGRHNSCDGDPELVFDKVGGKNVLSEVWFPNSDGFLLVATKEAHQHAVAGSSNPLK
jgi:hypothetical protein